MKLLMFQFRLTIKEISGWASLKS
ncbi:hypothetical protein Goshw_007244 [Gossypium schwendimanii]|uniref:Uncharacterized protein n=1 Tax=Gossypium schwendimanii TaxID=34291 RepID=A0A7J9N4R1_GOSSC|nr:hypothetical protein [Gossypium schwendimanii]